MRRKPWWGAWSNVVAGRWRMPAWRILDGCWTDCSWTVHNGRNLFEGMLNRAGTRAFFYQLSALHARTHLRRIANFVLMIVAYLSSVANAKPRPQGSGPMMSPRTRCCSKREDAKTPSSSDPTLSGGPRNEGPRPLNQWQPPHYIGLANRVEASKLAWSQKAKVDTSGMLE